MISLTVIGRLSFDKDDKTSPSGKVFYCFPVIVNFGKEKIQVVRVSVDAENCKVPDLLTKGTQVVVVGNFTNIYTSKTGETQLNMWGNSLRVLHHKQKEESVGDTGLPGDSQKLADHYSTRPVESHARPFPESPIFPKGPQPETSREDFPF